MSEVPLYVAQQGDEKRPPPHSKTKEWGLEGFKDATRQEEREGWYKGQPRKDGNEHLLKACTLIQRVGLPPPLPDPPRALPGSATYPTST